MSKEPAPKDAPAAKPAKSPTPDGPDRAPDRRDLDPMHVAGALPEGDALRALILAIEYVVQRKSLAKLGGVPPAYQVPVIQLHAVIAHGTWAGKQLAPDERIAMYRDARRTLEPAVAHYASKGAELATFARDHVTFWLAEHERQLQGSKAAGRVDAEVAKGGPTDVVDRDYNPTSELALIGAEIPKLRGTIKTVLERATSLSEANVEAIEHELKKLGLDHHAKFRGRGALLGLQNALAVLDVVEGLTKLTEPKFIEELAHVKSVVHGVETYAELAKAVVDIVKGATTLVLSIVGVIGKLANASWASGALGAAGKFYGGADKVLAVIEIVGGVAKLWNPEASANQKYEGFQGAAIGVAKLGGPVTELAIRAGFMYANWMGDMYGQVLEGLVRDDYRKQCRELAVSVNQVSAWGRKLASATILLASETDPAQREALAFAQRNAHGWLIEAIVGCRSSMIVASQRIQALRPAFANILAGTPDDGRSLDSALLVGAKMVEAVKGVFEHASYYFAVSTQRAELPERYMAR